MSIYVQIKLSVINIQKTVSVYIGVCRKKTIDLQTTYIIQSLKCTLIILLCIYYTEFNLLVKMSLYQVYYLKVYLYI